MDCEEVIRPVDFLKVGHHGSHNATPPDEILERLLPADRAGGPRRVALVSTQHDVYNAVPHPPTLDRIRARVEELVTTQDVAPGGVVEFRFGEVGD
jgi:hypothetical protein